MSIYCCLIRHMPTQPIQEQGCRATQDNSMGEVDTTPAKHMTHSVK